MTRGREGNLHPKQVAIVKQLDNVTNGKVDNLTKVKVGNVTKGKGGYHHLKHVAITRERLLNLTGICRLQLGRHN